MVDGGPKNEQWPGSGVTDKGIVGLFEGILNAIMIANDPETFPQLLGQLLSTQAIVLSRGGLYSLLYTTASLPIFLYLVLTKFLFLPNSQTQLSEIPFFFDFRPSVVQVC